jgi:hypothetical protein
LDLVTVGGAGSADEDNDDGLFWVFGCIVRDFFIPRQVSDNYMDYVKWKLLHRVFSSALQVLATQVLYRLLLFCVCSEAKNSVFWGCSLFELKP